ncbi:hypothetical protein [Sphingosinicella ginsenosidimutans]|uniref:Uncharacterized protein n=1 Tax=Allosphingosinicella ginsenosidimutans TaxID=1176539 RepID=A0A5C6TX02_9SPHN|nr:hypothetical protein [Sphingosinicella ginsenosidimutans]TXC64461.1 hypothetical protein FRZ32_12845 [Sphingosinicella ginsenosidimutans]
MIAAFLFLLPSLDNGAGARPIDRPAIEREIRRITTACHMPGSSLTLIAEGELRFRPQPDSRYENVDCVLAGLRKSGLLSRLPMGFVGNQAAGH